MVSVWFLCLRAYQTSWVILFQSHPCRRTVVVLYSHLQHHNDTIRTQEDLCRKIFVPLTLFVRVRKGCVGFYCERELETEQKLQYFDPHSYGRQRCVFLFLQGCSTGGPEAHSAGWSATSYQQLLWAPTQSGVPMAPSAWCGFPYHISSITPSDL